MSDRPAGPLAPGRVIAHYRVAEQIGRGGMGLVYKADDTRLGRVVALKILPDEVSGDPVALKRFRREAEAASALNHPSICTIYDIGDVDGVAYIAMEYVAGTPLDRRLAAGPLPLAEAVAVAIDVADALDAAHTAGILHRDVKPANIVITPKGRAKLLDFGLATMALREPADAATRTRLTAEGSTLGTVGYMSPEQVRGLPLDARSDLFSFGDVIVEMATGVRPFDGATAGLVFDAILNREPAGLATLAAASPALAEIAAHALEKDRDLRTPSAAGMRAELKRLARDLSGGVQAPAPAAAAPARRRSRAGIITLVAGSAAGLALLVGAVVWRRAAPPAHAPFAAYTIVQATSSGQASVAAISPDGRFIASAQGDANGQRVSLRNIATGSDTEILPPARVLYASLAFSPDGNYLYVRRAEGGTATALDLYRMPVLGGPLALVVHDIDTNVTFSPGGERMAYARANAPQLGQMSLLAAQPDGSGEQVILTAPIVGDYRSAPAWSPDGQRLAYTETNVADALGRVQVFDFRSAATSTLFRSTTMELFDPVWTPDGSTLIVRAATKSRALTGMQIGEISYPAGVFRTITNDTNDYIGLRTSADGRALVAVQRRREDRVLLLPGAGGPASAATELVSAHESIRGFTWTPAGDLVYARGNQLIALGPDRREHALLVADRDAPPKVPEACGPQAFVLIWPFRDGGSAQDIWRIDADGGHPTRLTHDTLTFAPRCTPDGTLVTFDVPPNIKGVPLAGGPERILIRAVGLSPTAVSPDGRTLALIAGSRDAAGVISRHLVLATLATGASRTLPVDPDYAGGDLRFTADGAAVAYAVLDKGVDSLRIQPLDGHAPHLIAAAMPGARILGFAWSADGAHLAMLVEHVDSDVVLLTDAR